MYYVLRNIMSRTPEEWAKRWLDERRAQGVRGLTLDRKGNSHYVYWVTSMRVPELGYPRKISQYIGILEPPGNLVISSDIDVEKMDPRAIAAAGIDVERFRKRSVEIIDLRFRGPMEVFRKFGQDIYDALNVCFPKTSDDLFMLAMARIAGRGRLCQAGSWFEKQDNIMCLSPHRDPEKLSESLKIAGGARDAQNRFFEMFMTPGKKMAVDMTFCFSRGQTFIVKKGYNRFRLSCGQFNLVVICGLDDKLPQSIKTVPGNVKEGSILEILKEMNIGTDCILVMDRGYFSEDIMDTLHLAGYRFVIPVRRDSPLYGTVMLEDSRGFKFRGNSIIYGIGEGYGFNAYRFENQFQRNTELSQMMGEEIIDEYGDVSVNYALDGDPSKAGNLILVTNLNEDPRELYTMFKLRCSVEECNDASKNVLAADSTYLRDSLSIMGYSLVTFIALRLYISIEAWIASKDMTSKYSPSDVLFEYSTMMSATTQSQTIPQVPPANVVKIEQDLGMKLFP